MSAEATPVAAATPAGAGVDAGAGGKADEDYHVDGVDTNGRDPAAFRDYKTGMQVDVVTNHYKEMRSNQCLDFVDRMYKKWHNFDHAKLTIREAFELLEGYVDSSDPDITLSNTVHAFQTAESIRAAGEPDWMVLTGLLHDMGKIMFNWGKAEDGQQGTLTGPQWALGGDTWVVGVPIPDKAVLPQFNKLNPDYGKYEGPCGMYEPGCGLAKLKFAYGHDEYMYQMLRHNKASLPEEAFAIIRYHSCYPWHTEDCYTELMGEGDEEMKAVVIRFNKHDLYTKSEVVPDMKALWPYYQGLVDRFCPGKLDW